MTLLQIFFIVSAFVIILLWFDILKRKRFNFLHIFVFLIIWISLIVFTLFPSVLNKFWHLFWVQRWADVLVYLSIIFLLYFVLFLLNKIEKTNSDLTQLIRNIAIENSSKKRISGKEVFIIPAYNEEKVIKNTIQNLLNKWYKNIIVVNDGSTDNTRKILESEFQNKIILLNHLKNRWQGAALETWFEYVRRFWDVDYVVTYDADWQHDINDLQKFYKEFEKDPNLEVVLWSRFLDKTSNIPFSRKIILNLWKIFTFIVSWKFFSDVHNGYRVFRKSALNKIKITLDGMAHASEVQDIIARKKIYFKEVPVNIKYTNYSLSKWQKSSNAINIALKMIWSKFFK